jgi:hypothetical protein
MHMKSSSIRTLLGQGKWLASVFPPGLSVTCLCTSQCFCSAFVFRAAPPSLSLSVRDELVAVATTQFPASSDWALAISQSTAVSCLVARSVAWPLSLYWLKTLRRIQPVEQLACNTHARWRLLFLWSASWCSFEHLTVSKFSLCCVMFSRPSFIIAVSCVLLCLMSVCAVARGAEGQLGQPPTHACLNALLPTPSSLFHTCVLNNITWSCVYHPSRAPLWHIRTSFIMHYLHDVRKLIASSGGHVSRVMLNWFSYKTCLHMVVWSFRFS